jgi:hypothetical protein
LEARVDKARIRSLLLELVVKDMVPAAEVLLEAIVLNAERAGSSGAP